jgi:ABC-2 type transport system permease protein
MSRALAAELAKLLSLPAIWLTLAGTPAVNLLLATAFTSDGLRGSTGNAIDIGLTSIGYTQAGFVILGVLATCSEYTGGQIRTTLIAMPRRVLQLTAKHVALAIVVLPVAALTAASGVALAAGVLGSPPAPTAHAVRTLAGATAYLVLMTLIGAAVGALARQTLPAVAVLLGYLFIAGPLLRDQVREAKYLPDAAGKAMWLPATDAVTPAQGAFLLVAWTAALVAVAVLIYRRRDA